MQTSRKRLATQTTCKEIITTTMSEIAGCVAVLTSPLRASRTSILAAKTDFRRSGRPMRLRLFTVHEMAPLTARQQKAAALTRWLQDLGAFVTSPLPLAPNQKLRFQVLQTDRNAVL